MASNGKPFVGYSELVSLMFAVLCIGGQVKIFICRTGGRVFCRGAAPSLPLLLSSMLCWLVTLLVAGLMDRNFGLVTPMHVYSGVDSSSAVGISMQVAWHRLPPAMLGYVVLVCVVLFLLEDIGKLLFYYIIGAYRKGPISAVATGGKVVEATDVTPRDAASERYRYVARTPFMPLFLRLNSTATETAKCLRSSLPRLSLHVPRRCVAQRSDFPFHFIKHLFIHHNLEGVE